LSLDSKLQINRIPRFSVRKSPASPCRRFWYWSRHLTIAPRAYT